MNPFLRKLLASLTVCLTILVGAVSAAPSGEDVPKVEWRIKVERDANDNPHSTVDLVINDKQIVRFVTPEHFTSFQVLPRIDYEDHRVPAKALIACYSWWAGSGTRLYVVNDPKGKLAVYRLDVDEEMTSTPRWRRVRTIKVESP